ncbi:MAG: hypothetical protein D6719_08890 [Candidatus Dadabacteria bacterium]|nr:MAG: hypothetical protein D6719_08890 [Candidatus Dadabacteria bacterium]
MFWNNDEIEARKRKMEAERKKKMEQERLIRLRKQKQAKIAKKKKAEKKRRLDAMRAKAYEDLDEYGIPLSEEEKERRKKEAEEAESDAPKINRGIGCDKEDKADKKNKKKGHDPEERDEFSMGCDLPGPPIPDTFRM